MRSLRRDPESAELRRDRAAVGSPPVAVGSPGSAGLDAGEPLPRRRLIFAIMAIALLMVSVDQTIVATALHAIQTDLDAELTWSGWTITVYALGQLVVMPLAGRLSDQYGRKRVLLIAVAVFTVASFCCGLATNIYMLVALRAVQALGGGAFMPSATGIIADNFGRERDRAVGLFTSVFPIGGIIGPILGGFFVAYSSWRTIFFVNVPIGIALFVLCLTLLRETRTKPVGSFDGWGVIPLVAALLLGMFGFTQLDHGLASLVDPWFLVPEVCALGAGYLFVRRSIRHPAPFIPIFLLRGRGFGAMNLVNLLFGSAVLGFGALVPLYAQQRFGMDALAAGTLLTARAVGIVCLAGLSVLLMRRIGYRLPIVVGFLTITAGMVVMSMSPPDGLSAYTWLALGAGISGLGMGLSIPASNNASLQLAPDQIAAIAGLRGMFRQCGAIIAISVTTAVLANSDHAATAQAHTFLVFGAVLVLALPLVFFVPDHRGRW